MSRIRLGLSGLNTLQLIDKSRFVVGRMTANPNFMSPIPALPSITILIDELVIANDQANTGAHSAIDTRNQKFDILLNAMRSLGAYVQAASNGVEAVITSSGFEVIPPRTPVGLPQKVASFTAVSNGIPGNAELKWKSLKAKADTYAVYATQTDPASLDAQWEVIGYSTKGAFRVENLPNRNQYYWFAVVAINAAGEGEMSDPAKCMVL